MDTDGLFVKNEDFEVGEIIWKDSYASFYLAKRKTDGKEVIAKIYEYDVHSINMQEMAIRESIIHHKLDHPAILKFIGLNLVSIRDQSIFQPKLFLEHPPNGTLREMIDKEYRGISNIDWSPTKKYISLLGISHAMKYLHHHGVIYRDLKLDNVLLDEHLYPKLYNFGLSRKFSFSLKKEDMLEMEANVGTPLYMAPELLDGSSKYSSAIDVFAFGIMAYEITTLMKPYDQFKGLSPFKLFIEVVKNNARPRIPEGSISQKMEKLITRCWDKEPENRPSFDEIFSELANDFSSFIEDIDEDEVTRYIEMLNNI